jgi:aminoglycoside 2'-N-acetyltransferase I
VEAPGPEPGHGDAGPNVAVAPTAAVRAPVLHRVRALLDEAFEGGFTEEDWAHTLGGWHVVVAERGTVVAHAAVVPRTLHAGPRRLRAGYVEGVATLPGRHGEGLGSRAMAAAGAVVRRDFEMGALSTGRHAFYERLGWERWRGPTYVRRRDRLVRTEEDDDGVMVLRFGTSREVDLTADLACDARPGDVW